MSADGVNGSNGFNGRDGSDGRDGERLQERRSTSTEIAKMYPHWMDRQTVEDEKSERGQNTQIAGTVKTYNKVGRWIADNLGKDVKILDASSGLGRGTLALRGEGFDIEDVEPYPGKGRTEQPTFGGVDAYQKAMDAGREYDFIISNAVLNVIPDDWRDGVLHDMAQLLKPGGKMFINTRKKGEEKGIKNKIELESPQEVLVGTPENITSYQRFFTADELKKYVEERLGEGYTVEKANESNSGTKGLAAVVVTKAGSMTEEQIKPIGRSRFGNVYDQFKGKVKEAFDFLLQKKGGDLLGVFHRKELGDIDLVWGSEENEEGLAHIISKHINRLHDFNNVDDAMMVIDDVVKNGKIVKDKWDKGTIEKDGYKVVIRKNLRDRETGEITDENKRWVVTAFDSKRSAKEKETSAITLATPDDNKGGRAVTPDASFVGKDMKLSSELQGKEGKNSNFDENIEERKRDEVELLREGDERPSEAAERLRERWPKLTARYRKSLEDNARRQWKKAHERGAKLVEKLGIGDRVTMVDSIDELEGAKGFSEKKRRSKGWYDPETGKIVIVYGNHRGPDDVIKTILHEGVAHHGLRKLFGEKFDTFLDKVYKNADWGIRGVIEGLRESRGLDLRGATEEYLAKLAEDTEFERAMKSGWFHNIKEWFLDTLRDIVGRDSEYLSGAISDNELRYILWRSYKNLSEPGAYRNVFGGEDATMQEKLKVGDYEDMSLIENRIPQIAISDADNASIKKMVSELSQQEVKEAYRRVNDKMRDEDGLDIDEQEEALRWKVFKEPKNARVNWGKALADLMFRQSDKYGSGMMTLRYELQDRMDRERLWGEDGMGAEARGVEERKMEVVELEDIERKAKKDGVWKKAPNGKDSRLSDRQWKHTRSNNFKRWFGDWEITSKIKAIGKIAPTPLIRHSMAKDELEKVYRGMGHGKNKNDGREVEFVHSSFGKILNHKGFDYSLIIPHLKEIFDSSIHAYSEKETTRPNHTVHGNYDAYHNYIGKATLDGKEYYVRFTIQELHTNPSKKKPDGFTPNQFHSANVTDVEIYSTDQRPVNSKIINMATDGAASTRVDAKLQKFFDTAREADEKTSKIVDENGEPLVVYHDTNSTIFVNKETGQNWDDLDWHEKMEWEERDDWDEYWEEQDFYEFDNTKHGRQSIEIPGFFFSTVPDPYHEYGKRRIAAFLDIKNPIIDPDIPNRGVTDTAGRDAMEEWMRQGYDGMIRTDENGNWREVVAFRPEQIKSATDNEGTYDRTNIDIRKQEVEEAVDLGDVMGTVSRIAREEKKRMRIREGEGSERPLPSRMFRRICNPTEANIRIFKPIEMCFKLLVITAFIGLQILIFDAAGLQIRQSCAPFFASRAQR